MVSQGLAPVAATATGANSVSVADKWKLSLRYCRACDARADVFLYLGLSHRTLQGGIAVLRMLKCREIGLVPGADYFK